MILHKSNTGWGGGCSGRITGNCAQGGKRILRGQHPHDLYNTNFSVWECIIIIGVGVGVRSGGGHSKNRSRSSNTFPILRIMSIMLNLLLCNINDLPDLGPVLLYSLGPVFPNSP